MSLVLSIGVTVRPAQNRIFRNSAFTVFFGISLLASMGMPAATRADSATLQPESMSVVRGQASKRTVASLSTNDQRGRSDNWSSYIEFYPASSGLVSILRFEAPVDIASQRLDTLVLKTNFKGPEWSEQRYTWHLRNFTSGSWVRLGTNQGVPDWVWTQQSFKAPGNANNFIDPLGRLVLRYRSPMSNDNSNVDYIALEVSTAGATNSAPAPAPAPAPEPAPEPAPDSAPTPQPTIDPVAETSEIWSPAPGTSFQIQLQGNLDTSLTVDMYDIDLFDTPASVISNLKSRSIAVICYFSAGSSEDWRPDAGQIPASVRGASNGWPGEAWLDIRAIDTLAPVMTARLDLAVAKGCDGVDPDNVDGFSNSTGFPLTGQHQLDYNKWLATEAHARDLSIGLKNDLAQIVELEPYFDWALNESCLQYNECELLTPFVEAGKAVFGIEYIREPEDFCSTTNAMNFDWLKKDKDLRAARESCR